MAAAPTPDPTQAGAAPGGASGAPSQAPAPPELMMLAQLHQACEQIATQYQATSAGLAKAMQGINEAMSAVVSQPQQQAPSQSPPY